MSMVEKLSRKLKVVTYLMIMYIFMSGAWWYVNFTSRPDVMTMVNDKHMNLIQVMQSTDDWGY